jgi:hypothetical protein
MRPPDNLGTIPVRCARLTPTACRTGGSVGQVVSPRVCKTLAFGCGSSILPRPTNPSSYGWMSRALCMEPYI